MYFFIAIILIAELIVAINVICLINKLDKKALILNEQVLNVRPKMHSALSSLKDGVEKLVLGVHGLCKYAELKKREYALIIARNILLYLLLFTLKGKSKKCVSAMQLAVVLKDCWDKGTSCN